jgi:hypothetical protein
MGVDCGDYNNDGHLDLVVTNFEGEPNSLFKGAANGSFLDETYPSGLGKASFPFVGWGVRFTDLDLDGFQDLFVVNGHVDDYADEKVGGPGYAQACRVYWSQGGETFSDVSDRSGQFFARRVVARGMALADYDNDGDMDVLIGGNNSPAVLLRNDSPRKAHWIRLTLEGRGCNRDALGTLVRVAGGSVTQTQCVRSATSYLSDHDRRLLFGIGGDARARVEARWPCGALQGLEVAAGESVVVRENGCKLLPRGPTQ